MLTEIGWMLEYDKRTNEIKTKRGVRKGLDTNNPIFM